VRSFIALAAAAVAAMLLQTTVFPALPGLPVVPDLVLVLAVYLGVRHQTVGGALGAFGLGYFLDTFSGTLLGLNAFALTAVYLGVQAAARHLGLERGLPLVAVVFLGALVRDLAAVGVGALVAARAPLWQHVLRYGLTGAATAALVAPAVFAAVRWEKRQLGVS
jgi:rod shape-determining protein MreD